MLGLAILVSGSFLALDDGTQLDVARGLGSTLYAPLQAVTQNGAELLLLRRENRQLRRVVATLNLERMRLVQLRDDRERLRREARFARDRFPCCSPAKSSAGPPTGSRTCWCWRPVLATRCGWTCR